MRSERNVLIIRQIPEADANIGNEVIDQMDRRGQHGVVAGNRERIVEFYIVHIIARFLSQTLHGDPDALKVLLRCAGTGELHNAHLDHLTELVEGLAAVDLIRVLDPGAHLFDVIGVPQQHLAVSLALNGAEVFQNGKALAQRATPNAEALGKVALRRQLLPDLNAPLLDRADQGLHNKLRNFRRGIFNLFQTHFVPPKLSLLSVGPT